MTSSRSQEIGAPADVLLRGFVRTVDSIERENFLSLLLTNHAEPIVAKIVRYKTREAIDDAEEIKAEVMLRLVATLNSLASDPGRREIEDFGSYVAVITYNACDRHLSRKYPNRRRLKNGLRYLLSHREGFAVWEDGGVQVAGYRRWQFSGTSGTGAKLAELQNDVRAFARGSEAKSSWSNQKNAYELLVAIFAWAEGPVELNLLTGICADFWNVTDETIAIDGQNPARGDERPGLQVADARPDALAVTEQRAYLQKLWGEIGELPSRQRAAMLLNLKDENGRGVIDLWLFVGVATTEKIAAALEMSLERLAEVWNSLPLEDNRIAEILGLTRQQVINLRKSARERLNRKMRAF